MATSSSEPKAPARKRLWEPISGDLRWEGFQKFACGTGTPYTVNIGTHSERQQQDGHPGVQRNIANILEFLAEKLQSAECWVLSPESQPRHAAHSALRTQHSALPLTVFVEGASGPFDLSLLTRIQDPRIRKTIADYLLDSARLSGPEYAAVLTTRSGLRAGGSASYTAGSARSPEPRASLELLGVEDPDLYAANLQAFKDTYAYYQSLPPKRHYPAFGEARPYGRPTFQDFLISPLLPESQRPLIIPEPLERYYRIARLRDLKFVESMLNPFHVSSSEFRVDPRETRNAKLGTVVLVVGGFHTPGITQQLRQRGIPYAVVTPRVDRLGHEALYVKRLLNCDSRPVRNNAHVASFKQVDSANRLAEWQSPWLSYYRRSMTLCQTSPNTYAYLGEVQNLKNNESLAILSAWAIASIDTQSHLLLTHLVLNLAAGLALQYDHAASLWIATLFSLLAISTGGILLTRLAKGTSSTLARRTTLSALALTLSLTPFLWARDPMSMTDRSTPFLTQLLIGLVVALTLSALAASQRRWDEEPPSEKNALTDFHDYLIQASKFIPELTPEQLEDFLHSKKVYRFEIPIKQFNDGKEVKYPAWRFLPKSEGDPGKGGIRFDDNVDEPTLEALSFDMDIKLAGIGFRGAKGGVRIPWKSRYAEIPRLEKSEVPEAKARARGLKCELEAIARGYVRGARRVDRAAFRYDTDSPAPDLNTDSQTMAQMQDEDLRDQVENNEIPNTDLQRTLKEVLDKDPYHEDKPPDRYPMLEAYRNYRERHPELTDELVATFTGKPAGKPDEKQDDFFGSVDREYSTGAGVAVATLKAAQHWLKKSPRQLRVAIQGFGNVGSSTARFLASEGIQITHLSDASGLLIDEYGIPIWDLLKAREANPRALLADLVEHHLTKGSWTFKSNATAEDILTAKVDVLIPAARERVIHKKNAHRIKAPLIVEAANGPVTPEAERILLRKKKKIVPDVIANAGGVIGSSLEYAQAMQGVIWEPWRALGMTRARIENTMDRLFTVMKANKRKRITSRQAAYKMALEHRIHYPWGLPNRSWKTLERKLFREKYKLFQKKGVGLQRVSLPMEELREGLRKSMGIPIAYEVEPIDSRVKLHRLTLPSGVNIHLVEYPDPVGRPAYVLFDTGPSLYFTHVERALIQHKINPYLIKAIYLTHDDSEVAGAAPLWAAKYFIPIHVHEAALELLQEVRRKHPGSTSVREGLFGPLPISTYGDPKVISAASIGRFELPNGEACPILGELAFGKQKVLILAAGDAHTEDSLMYYFSTAEKTRMIAGDAIEKDVFKEASGLTPQQQKLAQDLEALGLQDHRRENGSRVEQGLLQRENIWIYPARGPVFNTDHIRPPSKPDLPEQASSPTEEQAALTAGQVWLGRAAAGAMMALLWGWHSHDLAFWMGHTLWNLLTYGVFILAVAYLATEFARWGHGRGHVWTARRLYPNADYQPNAGASRGWTLVDKQGHLRIPIQYSRARLMGPVVSVGLVFLSAMLLVLGNWFLFPQNDPVLFDTKHHLMMSLVWSSFWMGVLNASLPFALLADHRAIFKNWRRLLYDTRDPRLEQMRDALESASPRLHQQFIDYHAKKRRKMDPVDSSVTGIQREAHAIPVDLWKQRIMTTVPRHLRGKLSAGLDLLAKHPYFDSMTLDHIKDIEFRKDERPAALSELPYLETGKASLSLHELDDPLSVALALIHQAEYLALSSGHHEGWNRLCKALPQSDGGWQNRVAYLREPLKVMRSYSAPLGFALGYLQELPQTEQDTKGARSARRFIRVYREELRDHWKGRLDMPWFWNELVSLVRSKEELPVDASFVFDIAIRTANLLRQAEDVLRDAPNDEPPADETGKLEPKPDLLQGGFVITAEMDPPTQEKRELYHRLVDHGLAQAVTVPELSPPFLPSLRRFPFFRWHPDPLEGLAHAPHAIFTIAANARFEWQIRRRIRRAVRKGARAILAVSGGHPLFRAMRKDSVARIVLPMDSSKILKLASAMRQAGEIPPDVQIWAVDNPNDLNDTNPVSSLAKKVANGAEAVLTQPPFLWNRFAAWLEAAKRQGLTQTPIIVSVPIITSPRNLQFWLFDLIGADPNDLEVKDLLGLFDRQFTAGRESFNAFRKQWTLDLIQKLRGLEGVAGVHLIPLYGWKDLEEILERDRIAQLLERLRSPPFDLPVVYATDLEAQPRRTEFRQALELLLQAVSDAAPQDLKNLRFYINRIGTITVKDDPVDSTTERASGLSFRAPIAIRYFYAPDGQTRLDEREIAIDIKQIGDDSAQFVRDLRQAIQASAEGRWESEGQILLEKDFCATSESVTQEMNENFWADLPEWMRALGIDYRTAINQSPDQNPEFVRQQADEFFARAKTLLETTMPLNYLEIGVASTDRARAFLNRLEELSEQAAARGDLWGAAVFPQTHYTLADRFLDIPQVQELRRQLPRAHIEHLILNAANAFEDLFTYRGNVHGCHICNVYDNLASDKIARMGSRHYQIESRAYISKDDVMDLARKFNLDAKELIKDLQTLKGRVRTFTRKYKDLLRRPGKDPLDPRSLRPYYEFRKALWDFYGSEEQSEKRNRLKLEERYVLIDGIEDFRFVRDSVWENVWERLWLQGDRTRQSPGAILKEVLDPYDRNVWMHLNNRALEGFLGLLAGLADQKEVEIDVVDIIARDLTDYHQRFRGPNKYDGSMVNWLNGALFKAFAEKLGFEVEFRPHPDKPQMSVMVVRRKPADSAIAPAQGDPSAQTSPTVPTASTPQGSMVFGTVFLALAGFIAWRIQWDYTQNLLWALASLAAFCVAILFGYHGTWQHIALERYRLDQTPNRTGFQIVLEFLEILFLIPLTILYLPYAFHDIRETANADDEKLYKPEIAQWYPRLTAWLHIAMDKFHEWLHRLRKLTEVSPQASLLKRLRPEVEIYLWQGLALGIVFLAIGGLIIPEIGFEFFPLMAQTLGAGLDAVRHAFHTDFKRWMALIAGGVSAIILTHRVRKGIRIMRQPSVAIHLLDAVPTDGEPPTPEDASPEHLPPPKINPVLTLDHARNVHYLALKPKYYQRLDLPPDDIKPLIERHSYPKNWFWALFYWLAGPFMRLFQIEYTAGCYLLYTDIRDSSRSTLYHYRPIALVTHRQKGSIAFIRVEPCQTDRSDDHPVIIPLDLLKRLKRKPARTYVFPTAHIDPSTIEEGMRGYARIQELPGQERLEFQIHDALGVPQDDRETLTFFTLHQRPHAAVEEDFWTLLANLSIYRHVQYNDMSQSFFTQLVDGLILLTIQSYAQENKILAQFTFFSPALVVFMALVLAPIAANALIKYPMQRHGDTRTQQAADSTSWWRRIVENLLLSENLAKRFWWFALARIGFRGFKFLLLPEIFHSVSGTLGAWLGFEGGTVAQYLGLYILQFLFMTSVNFFQMPHREEVARSAVETNQVARQHGFSQRFHTIRAFGENFNRILTWTAFTIGYALSQFLPHRWILITVVIASLASIASGFQLPLYSRDYHSVLLLREDPPQVYCRNGTCTSEIREESLTMQAHPTRQELGSALGPIEFVSNKDDLSRLPGLEEIQVTLTYDRRPSIHFLNPPAWLRPLCIVRGRLAITAPGLPMLEMQKFNGPARVTDYSLVPVPEDQGATRWQLTFHVNHGDPDGFISRWGVSDWLARLQHERAHVRKARDIAHQMRAQNHPAPFQVPFFWWWPWLRSILLIPFAPLAWWWPHRFAWLLPWRATYVPIKGIIPDDREGNGSWNQWTSQRHTEAAEIYEAGLDASQAAGTRWRQRSEKASRWALWIFLLGSLFVLLRASVSDQPLLDPRFWTGIFVFAAPPPAAVLFSRALSEAHLRLDFRESRSGHPNADASAAEYHRAKAEGRETNPPNLPPPDEERVYAGDGAPVLIGMVIVLNQIPTLAIVWLLTRWSSLRQAKTSFQNVRGKILRSANGMKAFSTRHPVAGAILLGFIGITIEAVAWTLVDHVLKTRNPFQYFVNMFAWATALMVLAVSFIAIRQPTFRQGFQEMKSNKRFALRLWAQAAVAGLATQTLGPLFFIFVLRLNWMSPAEVAMFRCLGMAVSFFLVGLLLREMVPRHRKWGAALMATGLLFLALAKPEAIQHWVSISAGEDWLRLRSLGAFLALGGTFFYSLGLVMRKGNERMIKQRLQANNPLYEHFAVYMAAYSYVVSARKVGVRAVDVPFFLSSFVIRIARFRPLFAEFPALPDDIFLIW